MDTSLLMNRRKRMTSREIVDAVIDYVRDENKRYAILIDESWGSGKTYLYSNYLADAIREHKQDDKKS